ncbi:predicted protein [Sclerotinia sclerotiorum 1980 UF-70]|uniref:Uncharacterized protein n=1 Tax=Sclerotinia sclerotiorum (strain ATCC 18683 / 1980 / Ss-1) TaxID=665079 RepID=A7EEK2_SCLS1|nr:predicted protein [Sclerotinia sclerotiorum 1980 UF-70]EDO01268.1 predicted protein [Sclerotinia sclerotiorum 1980 UF-70]
MYTPSHSSTQKTPIQTVKCMDSSNLSYQEKYHQNRNFSYTCIRVNDVPLDESITSKHGNFVKQAIIPQCLSYVMFMDKTTLICTIVVATCTGVKTGRGGISNVGVKDEHEHGALLRDNRDRDSEEGDDEMNGWSGNALLLRGLGGIVRVRLRVRVGLRCEELL